MGWMEFKIHLLQADRVSQARRLFTKQAEGQKALEGAHKVEWPSLMEDMQPKWGRRCTSATPTSCTSPPCTPTRQLQEMQWRCPSCKTKCILLLLSSSSFVRHQKCNWEWQGRKGDFIRMKNPWKFVVCKESRLDISAAKNIATKCSPCQSCARYTLHLHNQGVIQIAE